jgi:hypothetical protein
VDCHGFWVDYAQHAWSPLQTFLLYATLLDRSPLSLHPLCGRSARHFLCLRSLCGRFARSPLSLHPLCGRSARRFSCLFSLCGHSARSPLSLHSLCGRFARGFLSLRSLCGRFARSPLSLHPLCGRSARRFLCLRSLCGRFARSPLSLHPLCGRSARRVFVFALPLRPFCSKAFEFALTPAFLAETPLHFCVPRQWRCKCVALTRGASLYLFLSAASVALTTASL